jgi:anti-anti-sigma factor
VHIPVPPELRLAATRSDGTTYLVVAGEMDMATVGEFAATVREHLSAGPVLLDLRELSFMDSSGVRALDALVRDVESEGWTLAIRSDLHRNVRRVLALTGVLDTLPLQDPPPAASAS